VISQHETGYIAILNGLWKRHPEGVTFPQTQNSTNDLGLL